ncbi:MAG: aconitase X [Actinomycetota bacterium]
MAIELTRHDREMLDGGRGEAATLAMRIVVDMARVWQADRLIDVASAHVDSCLYHGLAGLDFAERLLSGGARVAVPTTLNVSSLDLLHPDLVRLDARTAGRARRLMDAYVAMGCRQTWTCAPYQLERRPALGEHVAWAESNAIVFANSVLGARTNRYGDFIDICAAITGRVPEAGLHIDEHRRGRIVFRLADDIPDRLLHDEVTPTCVGHIVGTDSGEEVPVIVGLPIDTGEDRLKALGAAAASSGAVAMFHAVGITPEAPTLEDALGGNEADREIVVTLDRLRAARDELTTVEGGSIAAVSVGTPHLSVHEVDHLATLVGRHPPTVPFYANTGRDVAAAAGDPMIALADAGVTVVTDTCTYITPILHHVEGPVMTNSAKWAWYAPANLGFDVVFGSLEECVRSAWLGHVWRDPDLWGEPSDA